MIGLRHDLPDTGPVHRFLALGVFPNPIDLAIVQLNGGMKIYTKTGDRGETGLYGADRVGKDHPRVEAYGTVDEANSAIGLAGAALPATHADMLADLEYLQNALFDLGADLATRAGGPYEEKLSRMDGQDVERLVGQKQIKTLEAARNTRRPQQPVT